uniref:hypothetical protein n=1 Tax=Methylobacterium sp. B34 TaxID=95563 RepID=UPI0003492F8D|nr:hypothetical protein [Methylobacterium sp. B34]
MVKLCNELLVALEGECVFYGAPKRMHGEPADPRRLFKLNGLWFEAQTETHTEERIRPSWDDQPPRTEFVKVERIVSVDLVMSHDVGRVSLRRPAIVMPGLTDKGNITFDDVIVDHRHMVLGNHAPISAKFAWNITPLNEERPWRRPGTTDSLAISEYEAEVRKLRPGVEDKFAAVLIDIRKREQAALAAQRERDAEKDAADNPLWGSW